MRRKALVSGGDDWESEEELLHHRSVATVLWYLRLL